MKRYVLIALTAIALINLFFLTERYQYVQHSNPSKKDWQAASALLAQNNHSSRQIYGSAALFPLPDTDTLLVVDSYRSQLNSAQIDALHEWVQQGGRLIIAAKTLYYNNDEDYDDSCEDEYENSEYECTEEQSERESDSTLANETDDSSSDVINYAYDDYDEDTLYDNDPLLYSFGISAWYVPIDEESVPLPTFLSENSFQQRTTSEYIQQCLTEDDAEQYCISALCGDEEANLIYSTSTINGSLRRLALPAEEKLMHIGQYEDADEESEDDEYYPSVPYTDTVLEAEIYNDFGTQVMRVSYGDGDVIAMTDFAIWHDDQLSYLDHAWLLTTLADGFDDVWWIHNIDMPPLSAWLWRQAWPMLIALSLALVVFLWRAMPRRGPLLKAQSQHARDFLNHLHAGGVFLQRTGQSQALLTPLRAQVRRTLSTHPAGSDESTCFNVAETLSGIPAADIKAALNDTPDNELQLTAFIDTLQILRSRL